MTAFFLHLVFWHWATNGFLSAFSFGILKLEKHLNSKSAYCCTSTYLNSLIDRDCCKSWNGNEMKWVYCVDAILVNSKSAYWCTHAYLNSLIDSYCCKAWNGDEMNCVYCIDAFLVNSKSANFYLGVFFLNLPLFPQCLTLVCCVFLFILENRCVFIKFWIPPLDWSLRALWKALDWNRAFVCLSLGLRCFFFLS